MLRNTLALRLGFSEYFGFAPKISIANEYRGKVYDESNYIYNTVFEEIVTGAAVSLCSYSKYIFLYMEKCAFFRCVNGKEGGCIYYYSSNGACYMDKVCAHMCCAETGSGQFLYCYMSDLMKAELNIITISECSPITMGDTSKGSPFYMYRGQIAFRDANISECTSGSNSGFEFREFKNVTVTYSNILKNYAIGGSICNLYHSSQYSVNDAIFNYTNIISNRPTSSYVLNMYYVVSRFYSCVFLENYGYLLYSNRGIFLNSSYINHAQSSILAGGTLYTFDLISSTINTETISIQRYSTYYCYNEFLPYNLGEPCQTMYPNATVCICSGQGELDMNIVSSIFASLFQLILID